MVARKIRLSIGWCSEQDQPDETPGHPLPVKLGGEGQCLLCAHFKSNGETHEVAGMIQLIMEQVARDAEGIALPRTCPWSQARRSALRRGE